MSWQLWRSRRTPASLLFVSMISLLACGRGIQASAAVDDTESKQFGRQKMEAYHKLAANFDFRLRTAKPTPLQLHPKPLLTWSNPLRPAPYGATYLWTVDGRPAVVGCLYEWTESEQPSLNREFHLLVDTPLSARYGKQDEFWFPKSGGVVFSQIPPSAGGSPKGTPSLQARRLARKFTARLLHLQEQSEFELRLLSRALYEYQTQAGDRYFGLFGFVQGTDPEVLLVLERNKVGAGFTWQYALARMTSGALQVQFDGKVVWMTEEIPGAGLPNAARGYSVFWDNKVRLPE